MTDRQGGYTFEGAIRVLFENDREALDAFASTDDEQAGAIESWLLSCIEFPGRKKHARRDWRPCMPQLKRLRREIRERLTRQP